MSRVTRVLEYAYRYAYALGGGVVLYGVGPLVPRHRRLLNSVAAHFGYRAPGSPRPSLPQVGLEELASPETCVQLRDPVEEDGSVALYELVVIASAVRERAPTALFEIGTFNGRTTLNLAANAARGAVTYTLDLPAAELGAAKLDLDPRDPHFIRKPSSGSRFADERERLGIRQLLGDSATFDFAPYRSGMDVVFVDGAHSYEYVLNDSSRALEMLAPGGVALWHDYGGFPGVTRALDELYAQGGVWSGLRHVRDTSLAVLRLPTLAGEPGPA